MDWFNAPKKRGAVRIKPRSTLRQIAAQSWQAIWHGSVIFLIVLGLLSIGAYFLYTEWLAENRFPLYQVRLKGEFRNLDYQDAQNLVKPFLGQNFFTIDITHLHTRLATHPWIEQTFVRRHWPDTLEVRFQERIAFGYWQALPAAPTAIAPGLPTDAPPLPLELLDQRGERFHPAAIRQEEFWPHLVGPMGHERSVMAKYQVASERLAPIGLYPLRVIQDNRRSWRLTLHNGVEVYLGRERFEERLQRLVDVYSRALAPQIERIAAIDLRYVNGLAVRWHPSSPPPKTKPKTGQRVTTGATPADWKGSTNG